MTNIEGRVRQIVSEQIGLPEAEIKNEQKLINDLGCDSLDEVELLMALEDEYDLRVEDDAAREVKTVQDLIDIVTKAKQVN